MAAASRRGGHAPPGPARGGGAAPEASHASYSARDTATTVNGIRRVEHAAELGALAAVRAGLVDGEREHVLAARDRVLLEQELGHEERVDHVLPGDRHAHRLADRHVPARDPARRSRRPDAAGRVREPPAPAEGRDPDVGAGRPPPPRRRSRRARRRSGRELDDHREDRDARSTRPPAAGRRGPAAAARRRRGPGSAGSANIASPRTIDRDDGGDRDEHRVQARDLAGLVGGGRRKAAERPGPRPRAPRRRRRHASTSSNPP